MQLCIPILFFFLYLSYGRVWSDNGAGQLLLLGHHIDLDDQRTRAYYTPVKLSYTGVKAVLQIRRGNGDNLEIISPISP